MDQIRLREMPAPALGFRFGADYGTKNIIAWSRILEQRRAYMNGEMTGDPFPGPDAARPVRHTFDG